jgi:hypothetical protein
MSAFSVAYSSAAVIPKGTAAARFIFGAAWVYQKNKNFFKKRLAFQGGMETV